MTLFEDRVSDVSDAPDGEIWPAPSNPMAVARQLIDDDGLRDAEGVLTVRWWRGAFLLWTGERWVEIADRAIKARIYAALEGAQYWKPTTGAPELTPWAPTRHKIADVAEALSAIVHVSERTEAPAWIKGEDQGRMLAVRNGLLDLRTRKLFPHTPRLFNLLALPYDFVPHIPYPARWSKFLNQLFADDQESIDLLQEWFGYILSGATDQHKILLLVGPPRSGKGTIARVLTALVGKENTAGPTLAERLHRRRAPAVNQRRGQPDGRPEIPGTLDRSPSNTLYGHLKRAAEPRRCQRRRSNSLPRPGAPRELVGAREPCADRRATGGAAGHLGLGTRWTRPAPDRRPLP